MCVSSGQHIIMSVAIMVTSIIVISIFMGIKVNIRPICMLVVSE